MIDVRDVTKVNIKYISPDGFYCDNIYLTDQEILYLRKLHKNFNIAEERIILTNNDKTSNKSNPRKEYNLSRNQKYNNGRCYTKKRKMGPVVKFVIQGLVIGIVVGSLFSIRNLNVNKKPVETVEGEFEQEESYTYVAEKPEYDNDMPEFSEEEYERMQFIDQLCNIYQVDYDIVYQKLNDLTEGFCSYDYLNGSIDGVVCKGTKVQAASKEELLICAVRCIKQIPNSLGVDDENLYIVNGYNSGTNYCEQISWISDVLGVDKKLIYAIVVSETSFNSDLFNSVNNPAGLKNNEAWWVFDTKEEGFIELCLEVRKYYGMIGESPEVVNYDVIKKISEIHAPIDDENDFQGLNEHWVDNVMKSYQYAIEHESELFGDNIEYENNKGF